MVSPSPADLTDAPIKLAVKDLTIRYGGLPVLRNVSLEVREREIFGIIGPANAGEIDKITGPEGAVKTRLP